jgi:hypothetical protein
MPYSPDDSRAFGVTHVPAPPNSTASFPPVKAVNRAGSTEKFEAFYERSFGETGRAAAATVLNRAEPDLETLSGVFGRNFAAYDGDRFVVVLARLGDGARTYREQTPHGMTFFCDLQTTPRPEPRQSCFFVALQIGDLLAGRAGWGTRIAAALARVLATAIYPLRIIGFATASVWLDGERENLTANQLRECTSDTGGAVLFLNYLHYQLGFSWTEIASRPEATLGTLSRRLTGTDQEPARFEALLRENLPPGRPTRMLGDNPFPMSLS